MLNRYCIVRQYWQIGKSIAHLWYIFFFYFWSVVSLHLWTLSTQIKWSSCIMSSWFSVSKPGPCELGSSAYAQFVNMFVGKDKLTKLSSPTQSTWSAATQQSTWLLSLEMFWELPLSNSCNCCSACGRDIHLNTGRYLENSHVGVETDIQRKQQGQPCWTPAWGEHISHS